MTCRRRTHIIIDIKSIFSLRWNADWKPKRKKIGELETNRVKLKYSPPPPPIIANAVWLLPNPILWYFSMVRYVADMGCCCCCHYLCCISPWYVVPMIELHVCLYVCVSCALTFGNIIKSKYHRPNNGATKNVSGAHIKRIERTHTKNGQIELEI